MQAAAVGACLNFRVNIGESSDDVAGSLQQAGYQCEIRPQNKAHNIIEVVKHDNTQ